MRSFRIELLGLLFIAAAPSCAIEEEEPGTTRLPLAGGAPVVRDRLPLLMMSGDPDENLFVTTGVPADQAPRFCTGEELDDARVDRVDYQAVALPSGAWVERYAGEVELLVYAGRQPWEWTADFGPFFDAFCDALLETAPIASGRGFAMMTANDWGGDLPQGWHWGLKAEGWLVGAAGEPVHVVHAGECAVTPGADGAFRCNTNVALE